MPDTLYQQLSADDRRYALRIAQDKSRQRAFLLEKDVWVVATLGVIFEANFGEHLTFKGETSLSKVWDAVRRFSEDIDITYDIRAFAPDLVSTMDDEALSPTRSRVKKWTRTIRARLTEWVRDQVRPTVEQEFALAGFKAQVRVEANRLYIGYDPLFEESGFVRPEVMVEFGARSTGEPHRVMPVLCDAAVHLPDLIFPQARAIVMLAERTFWEKATAIHVFYCQQRRRGERLSRHWHDLARLDEVGIAARALVDRELALSVARHTATFFWENDANGRRIDYEAAVSGDLQLVPAGAAREVLASDYARMMSDGMLRDESETFEALMERCATIEARANR